MVIKTCKCVCMNTSFKAFSDENKDVILSQNKCFNHPTTTQLPGALPPGTPSELCLRPVRGRGGGHNIPKIPSQYWHAFDMDKGLQPFPCPTFQFSKIGKYEQV